jgi:cytoskeleton protein RodZ
MDKANNLSRDGDPLQSPSFPMGTFAAELKSEREKRKIPLSLIAAETRISLRHLESLEEGRFADLPGGIYSRAFLKAYCEFLNLDSQGIMKRYEAEVSSSSEKHLKPRVHIPEQTPALVISPLMVWGLMLLISATGLFYSRKWISAIFSPYFSHSSAAIRDESVQPAIAPKIPESTMAPSTPSPQQAPDPAIATAFVGPVAASMAAGGSSETSVPSTPQSSPATTLRLEIKATGKCWISVDRDGKQVLQKVLQPGEVQSFDAAEKFRLVLGNAGAVRLKINGKSAKPLGKPGEVLRVLIDEKNLQDILDQTAG